MITVDTMGVSDKPITNILSCIPEWNAVNDNQKSYLQIHES